MASGNATAKASIEVICTACYVKADASVQITIDDSFNFTAAFDNVSKFRTWDGPSKRA